MFGELPQNFAEVAGKETLEIAASKSGFGNKETYRQAKTVTENATPELIEAMDKGDLLRSEKSSLPMGHTRIRRCGELLKQVEPKQGANQNIRDGADMKVLTRTQAAKGAGTVLHDAADMKQNRTQAASC